MWDFELERGIKSHAPNLQSKEMPSSPPTPLYFWATDTWIKNKSLGNGNWISG